MQDPDWDELGLHAKSCLFLFFYVRAMYLRTLTGDREKCTVCAKGLSVNQILLCFFLAPLLLALLFRSSRVKVTAGLQIPICPLSEVLCPIILRNQGLFK